MEQENENHQPPEQEQQPAPASDPDYRYDIKNSMNAAEGKRNAVGELYEWMESWVFAVVLILVIFTFFLRTAFVSGASMVPTLHDGDRLILQQVGYHEPQYGDIVVIDRTQDEEPPLIKRVIGRPGDIIDIDFENGLVARNGEVLEETYINEPTLTERDVEFPVTVPEGRVFVMGDNRNHSADSRTHSIGMIDERRVMGKAVFRFFPLGDAGKVGNEE